MKMDRTYAGIPQEYGTLDKSKTVLLTVPYDGTSTWGKGADKGPEAFLDASENMELFDIETKSEVYKEGVFLDQMNTDFDTPESMVSQVHDAVKRHILDKKFVTLFGGEHSVSIGAIRAFNESHENLTVLQIDAHADLRETYEGTPFNHACAMHEAKKTTNLVQVGIRSMDASERAFMNLENVFFAHQIVGDKRWADKALEKLTGNVYITFDLDAFDPSILPGTGTPEPGGLYWYETLSFLKRVFETKKVVGFDIVELCPGENDRVSSFTAAKLYYKMLSYKYQDNWI
ncbi:MAG: agmatinase [Crocinitomicaceae bacterium]|jgi:agmatinase